MNTNENEAGGATIVSPSVTVSEYPIRIREPVPSKDTAPMPFKVERAGRIVDVVGLPADVVVVQAALGRVRYSREEMKCSLAEHLALQPYAAKAGAYCVFTVMNLGSKPIAVTGKVLIEGEHGAAVEALVTRPVVENDATPSPSSSSSPRNGSAARRNPQNDAMVDAIIDGAETGDAVAAGKRTRSSLRASALASSSKPAIRSPRKPGDGASLTRSLKPPVVMTMKERRARFAADAVKATALATAGLLAKDDRVVVLHAGHAEMLDVTLSSRIPLAEDVRGEISAAFWNANEVATHAWTNRVGEVALRLSSADFVRLSEAIGARAEYALEDTDGMANAVRHALAGTTPTALSSKSDGKKSKDSNAASKPALEVGDEASRLATADEAVDGAAGEVLAQHEATSAVVEVGAKVTPINGKNVQDDGRPDSRSLRDETSSAPVHNRPGALHDHVIVKSAANEA